MRQSIPLLTEDDISIARQCVEMLETETDYAVMGSLNRKFHMALYSRAPNKRLLKLVEDGLNEEERLLRFNLSAVGLGKLSQHDHWELLRLVQAKSVELTIDAPEHHLNRGVDAINTYLKNRPVHIARSVTTRRKQRALTQRSSIAD